LNNPVLSPQEQLPASDWEHYILYKTIKDLLIEIPHYFESTISVSGVRATEIYPFSAVLGLMIEQEVVRTLNNLRQIWDANKQYAGYRFIRQSQAFPDVLLMNPKTGHIIFGIELKCWYLLAKEGEPSFRYHATPNVCTIADLIVIVPVFIHLSVQTAFSPSPIGFIMCFLGSNSRILSLIPWIGE